MIIASVHNLDDSLHLNKVDVPDEGLIDIPATGNSIT